MSWHYFLLDVVLRVVIGVACGAVLVASYRVRNRGRWVLSPKVKPHRCRTPNGPRRNARRWRCNTCHTLYEARGIGLFGEMVWVWDKVNEETGLTERQDLQRQIDENARARAELQRRETDR